MSKNFLSLMAAVLAIVFTTLGNSQTEYKQQHIRTFIKASYSKFVDNSSWTVFEYIGGPHDSPLSYVKAPYFMNISEFCPGNGKLCAIYAEEDLFNNPNHPTQYSLDYLLSYFGFYYYFPYEVSGVVEFKRPG